MNTEREIAPGIAYLRDTMIRYPDLIEYAGEAEKMLREMRDKGIPPEAMIAFLASLIGYSVGHGLHDCGMKVHEASTAVDLATEIIEASAADAFFWHKNGRP